MEILKLRLKLAELKNGTLEKISNLLEEAIEIKATSNKLIKK